MKKWIALCLALLLMAGSLTSVLADSESFDMSVIRNNEYLEIDVDSENNVAFVESTFSAKDRSFTHEYESANLYSTIKMDMLIIDYFDSDAYPILRMWITVSTDDDYKYINAITFNINGTEYRFSDVADKDWFYKLDNGYQQQCLIKFGIDNVDFFIALLELAAEWVDKFDSVDWTQELFTMTLHGTKDIKASVPFNFLCEFIAVNDAYADSNGIDSITKVSSPTPMKITEGTNKL